MCIKYIFMLIEEAEFNSRLVLSGRPFSVRDSSRTTRSEKSTIGRTDDVHSWTMDQTISIMDNNTYNHEIGIQWLQQAEAEHASVASFARHTLQLMSIGAPSELLHRSQAASIDEIKHAKMCYGFASIFLDQDMIPGSLDVENSLEKVEIKDIILSLIHEGCIEESLAALEAHFRAKIAKDSTVKATLKEIADDETNHATLAWDTIQWILSKKPGYHTLVQNYFQDEIEKQMLKSNDYDPTPPMTTCNDYGKYDYLHRFGVLGSSDRETIRRFGIKKIIKPTLKFGFDHFSSIFDNIVRSDMSII